MSKIVLLFSRSNIVFLKRRGPLPNHVSARILVGYGVTMSMQTPADNNTVVQQVGVIRWNSSAQGSPDQGPPDQGPPAQGSSAQSPTVPSPGRMSTVVGSSGTGNRKRPLVVGVINDSSSRNSPSVAVSNRGAINVRSPVSTTAVFIYTAIVIVSDFV